MARSFVCSFLAQLRSLLRFPQSIKRDVSPVLREGNPLTVVGSQIVDYRLGKSDRFNGVGSRQQEDLEMPPRTQIPARGQRPLFVSVENLVDDLAQPSVVFATLQDNGVRRFVQNLRDQRPNLVASVKRNVLHRLKCSPRRARVNVVLLVELPRLSSGYNQNFLG